MQVSTRVSNELEKTRLVGNDDGHRKLSYRGAVSLFAKQAVPAVGERVIDTVGGFLNNLFLAHATDPKTLPASAYMGTFQQFTMTFNQMVLTAVNISSGKSVNDPDKAAQVFRNGVVLAIILTAPTVLLSVFSKDILDGFGQDSELATIAQDYLRFYAIGILPELLLSVQKNFVAGVSEKPLSNAVIESMSAGTTTILSYFMINGKMGFPELGAKGFGLASVISSWSAFLMYSIYISCSKQYTRYPLLRGNYFDKPTFIELLKNGIPAGIMLGVELGTVFAGTLMAGKLGETSLIAQQIGLQYYMLVLSVIIAFARAAMSCVARQIGKQQNGDAIRIMLITSNAIGLTFATISAIVVAIFRSEFVKLFSSGSFEDEAANSLSEKLLWVNGISLLPDSLRFITGFPVMALDGGVTMLASTVVGLAFLGLPLSAVLGLCTQLGVVGMSIGRGCGVTLAALLNLKAAIKPIEVPPDDTSQQNV